eukprot:5797152-Prymnesium_polylepis.2
MQCGAVMQSNRRVSQRRPTAKVMTQRHEWPRQHCGGGVRARPRTETVGFFDLRGGSLCRHVPGGMVKYLHVRQHLKRSALCGAQQWDLLGRLWPPPTPHAAAFARSKPSC